MQRFYCERHHMSSLEGECDVCAMVERHTQEFSSLTAALTGIAFANADIERATQRLAQAHDMARTAGAKA